MEKLEQIKVIASNLKTGSTKAIKTLHKLVFEREGDRSNRKRLREFEGFTFASGSEEYKTKLMYADTNLGWGDLVSICNVLAIDYSGTKKELSQRICGYLMDFNELKNANNDEKDEEDAKEDAEEEDDDSNEDEVKEGNEDVDENKKNIEDEDDRRASHTTSMTKKNKFAMTFRDVEDSIRPFDGDEKYPVVRWITDFEEVAELFGWSDMQKLIFAKKSLRGLAKLFIQGERGINTWRKLKRALQDEFSDKINSAELHRQMDKRKIKKHESI